MPLLNFKRQFVEPIRSGRKHHTIRTTRKIPIKPGDKLYLYCGLRQKGAFRILPEPQVCTRVLPIHIDSVLRDVHVNRRIEERPFFRVILDGILLGKDECETLAVADGFTNFAEMMKFWTGRLPFDGHIIHWR